ncbi:hybrid sensor histidine kinase/response regulator [Foetidibacter luteolus]|uniref:hybrid sensor histidine kinase/response regulator n=1 Tax=Foetidibacter luteolus TaxID=2608880 RepID=UPI00129AEAA5|nr:ATP-binding protein [Foetidibacter luteolus]
MNVPLKILHVEDLPTDAALVRRVLEKGGICCEIFVVDKKEQFISSLEKTRPDLILCDHSLPAFNSREALRYVREKGWPIPFILVTATVPDNAAAGLLSLGADDYILKDRMERLPRAVIAAMEKWRLTQEKAKGLIDIRKSTAIAIDALSKLHESEANLNTIFCNTDTAYILIGRSMKVKSFNPLASQLALILFGKELREHTDALSYFPSERQQEIHSIMQKTILGHTTSYEICYDLPDGCRRWYYVRWFNIAGSDSQSMGMVMAITDISMRKQEEILKEKVAQDLARRNQALERFAFIVSHNLRAPVANIIGLTAELTGGALTERERKLYTEALSSVTIGLDRVVLDLNNILRYSSRNMEKREDIDFAYLVSETASKILRIHGQQAEISCGFIGIDIIHTNRGMLTDILLQLFENAVRFRHEKRRCQISVSLYTDQGEYRITVCDNGKGIDIAKNKDRLFGMYERFDKELSGAGMGLCLVKTLAEAAGGTICAESCSGKGSSFTLNLPMLKF